MWLCLCYVGRYVCACAAACTAAFLAYACWNCICAACYSACFCARVCACMLGPKKVVGSVCCCDVRPLFGWALNAAVEAPACCCAVVGIRMLLLHCRVAPPRFRLPVAVRGRRRAVNLRNERVAVARCRSSWCRRLGVVASGVVVAVVLCVGRASCLLCASRTRRLLQCLRRRLSSVACVVHLLGWSCAHQGVRERRLLRRWLCCVLPVLWRLLPFVRLRCGSSVVLLR